MARKDSKVSSRPISEINVTPLMDLTFLLLITFIITFPLLEQGIPVQLPEGPAAELSEDAGRTITIDEDGRYFVDAQPMTFEQLAEDLHAWGRADPTMPLLVRADERIAYGNVARILRTAYAAGLSRLALVTEGGTAETP